MTDTETRIGGQMIDLDDINPTKLIDKYIAEKDKPRDHSYWHVSSLGGCLSGAYLERKGVEPDFDFDKRTKRVFEVGEMFEEWLVDRVSEGLKDDLSIATQEDLISPNKTLIGHPDAVIRQQEGQLEGKVVDVWEVKTIHSRGFWHMDREGRQGYDHHRLQLWSYLKLINHTSGRLVYVSKDDLSTRQFFVDLDDKELEEAFASNIATLTKAWESGEVPEPIGAPSDWRYQRCRWHSSCLETQGVQEIWVKEKTRFYPFLSQDRYELLEREGVKNPDRFKVCSIKEYRKAVKEAVENGN